MKGKAELRKVCWEALREAGAARFPGVVGRIPNFVGAEAAAEHLAGTKAWARARAIKCNPDSPQRPVRARALREGKVVFMAVPKLAKAEPFIALDPDALGEGALWVASSIKGSAELGRPTRIEDMPPIDLIVTGCVGVTRRGARLGKGGGYSDLEYALLREHGLVRERTVIATTVHPSQIRRAGTIPMRDHDVSLDLLGTPTGVIACDRAFKRPKGIEWSILDEDKRSAIPVLR